MKINADALFKRAQKEFESSEPSDWGDIKDGELYTYTEDDLLPRIGEYQEKLADSKKNYTVTVPRFEFEESTKLTLTEIAIKAAIIEPDIFIKVLRKNVQMEIGRREFERANRNYDKQNNVLRKEMENFHKDVSKLIQKYIKMNSDLRSFIVQEMKFALPHIFDGRLDNFSEDDVLRFLHLMETTTKYHEGDLIDYSRTRTPISFFDSVLKAWVDFVPDTNKWGMKASFEKLLEELHRSMNLPDKDLKHYINKAKANIR